MPQGDPIAFDEVDRGPSSVPLCVDLDGTLLRGDLLYESLLSLVRRRPLALLRLPFWLAAGRAGFKQHIADAAPIRASSLPYNQELLEYLAAERKRGRPLYLVTASHIIPARAVAEHLAVFEDVMATDATRNLKGQSKRAALVARFGEGGFDYAGDSPADLAVWSAARKAILVDASSRVRRQIGPRAHLVFESHRRSPVLLALAAARAHQWIKNLLVFVPVLLAHRWLDWASMKGSALAFLAFSLGASAVYVLNDMLDIEADRHHPDKRRRPLASGELGIPYGLALAALLAAASLGVTALLPPAFGITLVAYFVATTAYSLVLKEVAVLDVLLLAALYTTRIMAGSAGSGAAVSEWLLAFSAFLFLSLGAVKRYGELRLLRAMHDGEAQIRRRGYFASDLELIVHMGIASGYIAVLVLALYITSDTVTKLYARPGLLWLICALVLYWISRIWLLAHRGQVHDDPLAFAVSDRATWVVAALGALVFLAASRMA